MESALCSSNLRITAIQFPWARPPPAGRVVLTKTTLQYSKYPSSCHQRRLSLVCNNSKYYKDKGSSAADVGVGGSVNMDDIKETRMRKMNRAGATSSVMVACVVGMISLGLGLSNASAANRALANLPGSGRVAVTSTTGGLDAQYAIASLMQVSEFLSCGEDATFLGSRHLAAWRHQVPKIDPKLGPSKKDVDHIKKEAMHKIKLGNSEEAERMLKDEYQKWKALGGEVKYNLEMAIVEILISQGKYKEASEYECIKKEERSSGPSDPRLPLYKAIIYTRLMNKNDEKQVNKAKELWDEFKETLSAETGKPE